jgi:hypothetical protein
MQSSCWRLVSCRLQYEPGSRRNADWSLAKAPIKPFSLQLPVPVRSSNPGALHHFYLSTSVALSHGARTPFPREPAPRGMTELTSRQAVRHTYAFLAALGATDDNSSIVSRPAETGSHRCGRSVGFPSKEGKDSSHDRHPLAMNCVRIRQPFFYPMQIQKLNRRPDFAASRWGPDYNVKNSLKNLWIKWGCLEGAGVTHRRPHLLPPFSNVCSQTSPAPKSLSHRPNPVLSTPARRPTSNNQQSLFHETVTY